MTEPVDDARRPDEHPAAPAANPFAAPVRAPRERWVNPAKRRAAGTLALVAALILVGAGVLIGLAVGGDGHDHRPGLRLERGGPFHPGQGQRGYPAPGGRLPGLPGRGGVPFPGRHPGFPTPAPTSTGTTSAGLPSASPTSSHR